MLPTSPRRPMVTQPEFWLLMVTMVAGMARLDPLLSIGLSILGLSISALPKYVDHLARCRALGLMPQWLGIVALSLLNSAGTAAACYGLGRLGASVLP